VSRHTQSEGIPDARWINRNLAIAEVARALECRSDGHGKLHCWHPEKHKNGDRSASVGIDRRTNRVKCFGCNTKSMSVLDFVMDVHGFAIPEAIRWLDEQFDIPHIPKRKHLREAECPRFEVGRETPMELLVRSGVWARLSPPAQRIFPVLLSWSEPDEKRRYQVKMSYRAIMRHSGVRSYNAVRAALTEFREWRLVESLPVLGQSVPIRPASEYLITPYSNEFQELATAVAGEHRAAIQAERECRKQARAERLKLIRMQRTPQRDGT
jgi:hypothetical protein